MKKTIYRAMTLLPILLLATSAFAQTTDETTATPGTSILDKTPAAPATANPSTSNPGASKVRIVRLSQVKGAVEIDRHIGRGFEPAIANLPVVEQSQLRTGEGIAEVEFEDNSSLRLAPNSLVEFPTLERSASGATLSTAHLIKGTAYVSLVKPQDKKAPANQFTLMFGERKLNLDPATHVRLDLQGSQAKLAVLDGAVRVDGGNGAATIAKKKTATFQIFDQNEPTIAKDTETSPFDAWDSNEASYHSKVASMSAFNNSPYSYGLNDMMYYGSFVNTAGCGSMWRPYFASAAWDPFANGTWAWYQGAGYSWVSPYPWGWTPYHYGSWAYCPDAGWGWMPGGGWYGVNNYPVVSSLIPGGGNGGGVRPVAPPKAPSPTAPAMIAVNTKPLARSEVASGSSFVFRKDSAGMGVPRETLGHLDKFSREADSRGSARTEIYMSAPQTNRPNGATPMSGSMATSIHRGSAPAAVGTSSPTMGGAGMSSGSARQSAGPAPGAPIAAPSSGGTGKK
jgi:hypothetical protein